MIGIYKITNMFNSEFYVGATCNIKRRFAEHKCPKNLSRSTVLARAFRKYGVGNFSFEILQECRRKDLAELESLWVKKLRPRYNMNEGGIGNPGHSVSEAVRSLLSLKGKQQWDHRTTEEKLRFVSNNLKGPKAGHSVSPETREKLRQHNLGKKWTEDQKIKTSAANKTAMLGNQNGNKRVLRISSDGSVIVYQSVTSASIDLGIQPSSISKVLNGKQLTAGAHRWAYLED